MNLKKILTVLIIVLIVIVGTRYGIKKYVYPYPHKEYVNEYSKEYGIDPLLVLAVIKTESRFNKDAESKKGAKGLMQIMDSTGEWIAEEVGLNYFLPYMLFDPETNIRFGCWYLNNLENQFNNLDLVLAAYNGGSGNVTKWLGDPQYSEDGITLKYIPFPETKKYVDKVRTNYSVYKYLYK